MLSSALPIPGLHHGVYPERRAQEKKLTQRLNDAMKRLIRRGSDRSQHYKSIAANALATTVLYQKLPDNGLLTVSRRLRHKLQQQGLQGDALRHALALNIEVIRRGTGYSLYPVQVMAAAVMLDDRLAEMSTGEGKTLSTLLAAATAALAGIPVHIVTANDYLVERDAAQAADILKPLKLSVGAVIGGQDGAKRRAQYQTDLCYCTGRELVFDYLKDQMSGSRAKRDLQRRAGQLGTAKQGSAPLLRGICFALVDEADAVLLDEATTPLILSKQASTPVKEQDYRIAMEMTRRLDQGLHFEIDGGLRKILLTATGEHLIEQRATAIKGLWNNRRFREELVTQALTARHLFMRDRDYLIRDEKIHIIDPTTGRIAEGRQWSRGLHQLVEIKEDCQPSAQNQTMAQITYQTFFPRYLKLGGTSATLHEARSELLKVYGLPITPIPRHRPWQMKTLRTQLYASTADKWAHVVKSIRVQRARGRAVLIGTDSVRASLELSALLQKLGIEHDVLTAQQDAEEAAIIAQAGQPSQVTVTTNMAGRGTDIALHPKVKAAGGLHVVSCQYNGSPRIDRQLIGRAARQGDPGSNETVLCLDDELMQKHLPQALQTGLKRLGRWLPAMPPTLLERLKVYPQWREEWRQRDARAQLRRSDKQNRQWLALAGPGE